MDAEAVAQGCKALAHPVRVQIVQLLAAQTECRGADVFGELPLAQSTVSQHLRVLKDAGVVRSRSVGTSAVYCLVPEVLEELSAQIAGLGSACAVCE
jgi:ArsR family transcriptional regulator